MSAVHTRESRQAAERVLGLVAHAYARVAQDDGSRLIPSVCGSIFDHPDPWSTASADYSLERIKQMGYPGPVVKTWAGR